MFFFRRLSFPFTLISVFFTNFLVANPKKTEHITCNNIKHTELQTYIAVALVPGPQNGKGFS